MKIEFWSLPFQPHSPLQRIHITFSNTLDPDQRTHTGALQK